ncbi:MAG: DUF4296 domain-containing protein [Cyclobacteriaceae bacterium]|nr:DUF4296 domain-containing protein [Cyclobacteriaceae bacterium]
MGHLKNYLLLSILSLLACKQETPPPDILSPAEFSKFLVEVYLAEARMNSTALQRDSAIKVFAAYENKLFNQFNLSDSIILKTQQYYMDHPQQLEKIYDSVIDTLNLREKKLQNRPADTLQKENRIRKPESQQ